MSNLHATCLVFGRKGVLIRGPSGAGKSALALRLIDGEGLGLGAKALKARLVADDQVVLARKGKSLVASAPKTIAGLIEVRGLGVLKCDHVASAVIALVVDLAPVAQIPRLAETDDGIVTIEGVALPRIRLDASLAQATAIVRAAITAAQANKASILR